MDGLQQVLARNLLRYRKELGLSQERFAELLGFHRTHTGALERGEKNPTLRSLERIAAALQIDPLDLLRE